MSQVLRIYNVACHGFKFIYLFTGYPDGQLDSFVDEDTELTRLKEKVDAGADFIITQLFYDADQFLSWYKKLRRKGLPYSSVPILINSRLKV